MATATNATAEHTDKTSVEVEKWHGDDEGEHRGQSNQEARDRNAGHRQRVDLLIAEHGGDARRVGAARAPGETMAVIRQPFPHDGNADKIGDIDAGRGFELHGADEGEDGAEQEVDDVTMSSESGPASRILVSRSTGRMRLRPSTPARRSWRWRR